MPDVNGKGGRIRAILCQIEGVLEVQVEEGPAGIDGIEVQVSDPASIRQVTRDVESALVTGLGFEVDHRLIRIEWDPDGSHGNGRADNGRWKPRSESHDHHGFEPFPAQGLQQFDWVEPPARESEGRRIRLVAVRAAPDGRGFLDIEVEVEASGEALTGRFRDADTARGRLLVAGRATLQALESIVGDDAAIALEGIEELEISGARGLLAVLSARVGRKRPVFHGSALLRGDPLEAAARAVLDALNRFHAARGSAA